jgi:hypothetical protein
MWFFTTTTVLLLMLWIASLFVGVRYSRAFGKSGASGEVAVAYGRLSVEYVEGFTYSSPGCTLISRYPGARWFDIGGELALNKYKGSLSLFSNIGRHYDAQVPLPLLICVSAVAAQAARSGFRFSLKFLLVLIAVTSIAIAWYGYWQPHLARPPISVTGISTDKAEGP